MGLADQHIPIREADGHSWGRNGKGFDPPRLGRLIRCLARGETETGRQDIHAMPAFVSEGAKLFLRSARIVG